MIRLTVIALIICSLPLLAAEKKVLRVSVKEVETGKFTESRTFLKELKEYNNFADVRCLKMDLSVKEAAFFKKDNQMLEVKIQDSRQKMMGKLIKSRNGAVVVVGDPDYKIKPNSAGSFSVSGKVHKNVLVIDEQHILKDENGSFVYIKKRNRALKRRIKRSPESKGKVMVKSGLKDGDILITGIKTAGKDIGVKKASSQLAGKVKVTTGEKVLVAKKKSKKKNRKGNTRKRKGKSSDSFLSKLDFNLSVGYGSFTTSDLNSKYDGNSEVLKRYADINGLSHSAITSIKDIDSSIPVNLTINYHFKNKIYFKVGVEFASGKVSPSGTYTNTWPEINLQEKHEYKTENKVSYVMPYVGVEYRFTEKIGIYGNIGLNSVTFKHKEQQIYTEPGLSQTIDTDLEATGSALGITLGGKYIHKLSDKISLHGKIEFTHSKISSLSGDRTIMASDSVGNSKTFRASGTLYDMEIDPYGREWWIEYWDMEGEGTPENRRNLKKKSLNLTAIKLMIGITF